MPTRGYVDIILSSYYKRTRKGTSEEKYDTPRPHESSTPVDDEVNSWVWKVIDLSLLNDEIGEEKIWCSLIHNLSYNVVSQC